MRNGFHNRLSFPFLFTLCVQIPILVGQQIQLAWTPSNNPYISHHNIYRSINNDSSFVLLHSVNLPDTTYVDTDVQTGIHYPKPIHLQNAYADLGHKKGDFPQAERLADRILSLPMFPELTDEQIQRVASEIRRFFERI